MTDTRRARRHLLELRARLLCRTAQPAGATPIRGDEAEQAAATLARDVQHLDVGRVRQRVQDVEAALVRIDAGTYPWCEDCGEDIPATRREAIPETATCLRCAERRAFTHERLRGPAPAEEC